MAADGGSGLSAPLVEELLAKYADLLRVGCIAVNGEALAWETHGSTEQQLQCFSEALRDKLRQNPELRGVEDSTLQRSVYWVCKGCSFNYVLMEVVLLLQRRVGFVSTIGTRDDAGNFVDYGLDVLPGPKLRVSLNWRRGDNILAFSPESGEKQVKGSLSYLAASFALPPPAGLVPEYELRFELRRSIVSRMATKLAAGVACGKLPPETVLVDAPLECHEALEVSPIRRSGCIDSEKKSKPRGLLQGKPPALIIGQLRVRRLTAENLRPGGRGFLSMFASPDPAVRCYVAGQRARGVQSRGAKSGAHVEWAEELALPLRAEDLRLDFVAEVVDPSGSSLGVFRVPLGAVLLAGGRLAVGHAPLRSEHSGFAAVGLAGGVSSGVLSFDVEFLPAADEAAMGDDGEDGEDAEGMLTFHLGGAPQLDLDLSRSEVDLTKSDVFDDDGSPVWRT